MSVVSMYFRGMGDSAGLGGFVGVQENWVRPLKAI